MASDESWCDPNGIVLKLGEGAMITGPVNVTQLTGIRSMPDIHIAADRNKLLEPGAAVPAIQ